MCVSHAEFVRVELRGLTLYSIHASVYAHMFMYMYVYTCTCTYMYINLAKVSDFVRYFLAIE